jgi:predicted nucleic acid-binding protein
MIMRFADTFYFLALLNPADAAHRRAVEFSKQLRGGTLTTDWVLVEVADAMAAPAQRTLFVEFLEMLMGNPRVTIVPATRALFLSGFALYRNRPDKSWSFTDCVSFTTMNEFHLTEALTGDHHFEQAGFHALLK